MTAAAQLLDAIVPLARTRLPRGVDIDYLDATRPSTSCLSRSRPSAVRAP